MADRGSHISNAASYYSYANLNIIFVFCSLHWLDHNYKVSRYASDETITIMICVCVIYSIEIKITEITLAQQPIVYCYGTT